MDDEVDPGYRWEGGYEKTWENIEDKVSTDKHTHNVNMTNTINEAKRQHLAKRPVGVKLVMMRHLVIILDMSDSMNTVDIKQSRFKDSIEFLKQFILEFFDKNSLSQLAILGTYNKRVYSYSPLSGCVRFHLEKLKEISEMKCQLEPSLQNCLITSSDILKNIMKHSIREILIIYGSLTTCDPGDIDDTIKNLIEMDISCSIIHLAAETRICKKICEETKGSYHVILDATHFLSLICLLCQPPPASSHISCKMIKMGFPHRQLNSQGNHEPRAAVCACHGDNGVFSTDGYFCPQCQTKYCDLPVDCTTCGLTLVAAPHISRSYHHLFPIGQFKEIPANPQAKPLICRGCNITIQNNKKHYRCNICDYPYCCSCDLYIHEMLNNCPKCASDRDIPARSPSKSYIKRVNPNSMLR